MVHPHIVRGVADLTGLLGGVHDARSLSGRLSHRGDGGRAASGTGAAHKLGHVGACKDGGDGIIERCM